MSKPKTITVTNEIQRMLPPQIRRKAGFKVGDELEVKAIGGIVTLISKLPAVAEDEYTPAQRKKLDALLAVGDAQAKAGLTYGPFDEAPGPLKAILKEQKRTRRITLQVPEVLLEFLEREAKRLSMTLQELIVTILQTHRFADRREQLITLAIAQGTGSLKTGRYEA
jgi:bifunctional DNA-binding transcriptional regulator/antitoxin component of YhaV-PrlF toxin-antitoxin module